MNRRRNGDQKFGHAVAGKAVTLTTQGSEWLAGLPHMTRDLQAWDALA
jgi:hypothetical protein